MVHIVWGMLVGVGAWLFFFCVIISESDKIYNKMNRLELEKKTFWKQEIKYYLVPLVFAIPLGYLRNMRVIS